MGQLDIRAEKLNLIKQLLQINDEELLQAVKSLLEFGLKNQQGTAETDFWEELTEAQKQRVEESIQSLSEGKGIPHEEVMAQFRNKYSK